MLTEDDVRSEVTTTSSTVHSVIQRAANDGGVVSDRDTGNLENQLWLLALTAGEAGYRKGFADGVKMILERQRTQVQYGVRYSSGAQNADPVVVYARHSGERDDLLASFNAEPNPWGAVPVWRVAGTSPGKWHEGEPPTPVISTGGEVHARIPE